MVKLIFLLPVILLFLSSKAVSQDGDSKTKEDSIKVESIYDEGLWLKGKDDKIKIFAWAQEDARIYNSDYPESNTFLNRRARLGVIGTLEHYFNFQVMIALERSTDPLQFAWVEYAQFPFAQLRMGQFKEPYSREELTPDGYLDLLERSVFISNFTPSQDIGLMLHGKLLENVAEYGIGAFNGRGRNRTDNNNDKEIAGRLDLNIFRNNDVNLLKGLYLGGSFTTGKLTESLSGVSLRTAGQTRFFNFNDSVSIDDKRLRSDIDFEWLYGPATLKGEWDMLEYKNIMKVNTSINMKFEGWYISGTIILTGEKKIRNKPVKPRHDFNPLKGKWGAFEIAGRYDNFTASNNSFTQGFASGSNKIKTITAGFNWTLNKHVRLSGNYFNSKFNEPLIINGQTIEKEDLFLFRFQFEY